MASTPSELERAHNQGQTDESEDRSGGARGLHQAFYTEEEREAYAQGVENTKEQKESK